MRCEDEDLRKAFRDGVLFDVAEQVTVCLSEANQSHSCFQSPELRHLIAGVLGVANETVTESDVYEFLEEAARQEAYRLLKECNTTITTRAECKEQARRARAELTGRNISEIDDFKMGLETLQEAVEELSDQMVACVEDSGDNATLREACKDVLVQAALDVLGTNWTAAQAMRCFCFQFCI